MVCVSSRFCFWESVNRALRLISVLDSVRVLDCESTLNRVLSTFALVDSVIVFESTLDSVCALESILFKSKLCVCGFVWDCVDSF